MGGQGGQPRQGNMVHWAVAVGAVSPWQPARTPPCPAPPRTTHARTHPAAPPNGVQAAGMTVCPWPFPPLASPLTPTGLRGPRFPPSISSGELAEALASGDGANPHATVGCSARSAGDHQIPITGCASWAANGPAHAVRPPVQTGRASVLCPSFRVARRVRPAKRSWHTPPPASLPAPRHCTSRHHGYSPRAVPAAAHLPGSRGKLGGVGSALALGGG